MNRALEWWKEVPGTSDDVLPQLQSKFPRKGNFQSKLNLPVEIIYIFFVKRFRS